jgi:hypothetical protein
VSFSVNFMGLIVERYGPFAFGVLLLVIVWQTIAQPQIANSKIDFAQQQSLVKELAEVANTFRIVGEQQRQTADVLKATTELLEKTASKLAEQ